MSRTGQMKTKLMDVVDSLDALERTPTAFRWTPAMSAIWPKDYRPTMTGLLAMWEAMHDAAEYSSSQAASDYGWVENKTFVQPAWLDDMEVVHYRIRAGSTTDKARAGSLDWGDIGGPTITHWRPAK